MNKIEYRASIIVTTYNQILTLGHILDCLLNQKTEKNFEIILCDDGSTEETFQIFSTRASSAKIPMRYVWQQDRGFRAGQSRNNGIKLSRGEILIFLDGDSIPPLNFVEKHINSHRKDPSLIVAGDRLFCHDYDFVKAGNFRNPQRFIGWLEKHAWVNEQERNYREGWLQSENPWKAGFASNMSIRRSPEVCFDDNFLGWGIEDWEFVYRMSRSGKKFHFAKDIIVYHLDIKNAIFNAFRNNNHEEMVLFARNALYFIDKYPDDSSLRECTIAFRHYELDNKNNRWYWDKTVNYSVEEGIKRLREWLLRNSKEVDRVLTSVGENSSVIS